MMEKLAQAGEGGGVHAHLLHYIHHHVQSCDVYAPAEKAATPSYLLSTPILYVLCGLRKKNWRSPWNGKYKDGMPYCYPLWSYLI